MPKAAARRGRREGASPETAGRWAAQRRRIRVRPARTLVRMRGIELPELEGRRAELDPEPQRDPEPQDEPHPPELGREPQS